MKASHQMDRRPCEACGSSRVSTLIDNLEHVYKTDGKAITWHYRLLQCDRCGLGFVHPKPAWNVLQTFYDDEYGSYAVSSLNPEQQAQSFKYLTARLRFATRHSQTVPAVASAFLGLLAEALIGRTVSYSLGIPLQLPHDARIFEMGYGAGDWLLSMSALGYCNLHGYDIDANTQNVARLEQAGISTSSDSFLDNRYEANSFDCIRLEHVFEHLLEPVAVLAKCREMLKPGGVVVMNFPCFDSWSVKISMQHFCHLDLPRHLYHHTPSSVRFMLKQAGFTSARIKSYSVMNNLVATLNAMERFHIQRPIRYSLESLAQAYKVFGALTGKGELLTTWARK